MTLHSRRIIPAFYLLAFLLSCDIPDCKNDNPIFDKYSPDTKEYMDELIEHLGKINHSKLTFWFDKYIQERGQEFIYVFIQSENLCTKIVLTVYQWDEKLEGIINAKGMGYGGAELIDLKSDIRQDSTMTEFVYLSLDNILD